jgi:phosphoglycolate phosphatase-like HAD superfamily hydrolase
MTAVRAIVLDFDGVLLDSEAAKAAVFDEVFSAYPEYAAAMAAFHQAHVSLPRRAKFEHCVFSIMGRPGDTWEVETMIRRFSGTVVDRVAACAAVPGADAFLAEFSGRVPLYVASVTPEPELRTVIEARGWAAHFTAVFGDPPTPKPQAIGAIVARECLAPPEVVFVGDSAGDYEAARATGVEFIARDSGLSFGGAAVRPYPDLQVIADVLRPRVRVG